MFGSPVDQFTDEDIEVFTDGSGGMHSSDKRLRRCAYLDVHQTNYKSYELYNSYKKVVNSDAANNQTIAIIIVLGLIIAASIFLFT